MTVEVFDFIKASRIFSLLDDDAIHKIIKQVDKVHLNKNDILFQQGDFSDGLYILVTGRLVGYLKTAHNPKQVTGIIQAGETVGELGAISHEPRGTTVRALDDSVLLKLSVSAFSELCNEYPSLLLETMNTLISRSRALLDLFSSTAPQQKRIVIFPANQNISLDGFVKQLQGMMMAYPDMKLVSESSFSLTKKTHVADLSKQMDDFNNSHKKVIYLLSANETLLTKIALEKADMVYIVTDSHAQPHMNRFLHEYMNEAAAAYRAKPELIILHTKKTRRPTESIAWLKIASFGLYHHIRMHKESDWQRLLRFFNGTAVGVVLGGGGVRSWAHIGALKALTELDIPIDIIGGVSGGSIVAGYYALYETHEDLHAELHKLSVVTHQAVKLYNLTWPVVSLFNGKAYTQAQQKIFGRVKIENLWLPFFCVSSNLAKASQVIHRVGKLWKKIRASTSVPGIFPPMVIRGNMYFDGGLIDNLPVDVMRNMSPSIGTIIAVELIHHFDGEMDYKFPPSLTLWQVLLFKLRVIRRRYRFPPFVETFLQSLLLGSATRQRENATAADVLIRPDLSRYGLLSITQAQEKELIDIGYHSTIKSIKKWQQSLKKNVVKESAEK